jgi:hypothetical protein
MSEDVIWLGKVLPQSLPFVASFLFPKSLSSMTTLSASMVKTRTMVVRITLEQEDLLERQARAAGFVKKSEYVRVVLFKKGVCFGG